MLLSHSRLIPYNKNNMCFVIQNTNELIDMRKNTHIKLFENIFVEGIQNAVLIGTLMLLLRVIPNSNPPKFIVRLTEPIINLSKKIINFDNYYYQIGLSSSLLTYIAGSVAAVSAATSAAIIENKYADCKTKLLNSTINYIIKY
jgi:hypothetical protein